MYNKWSKQKKFLVDKMKAKQEKEFEVWKSKYNKIRDRLLRRYQKRVQNFLYKMEDDPVVFQQNIAIRNPFRDSANHQKYISRKPLVYKDLQDWKSVYTPLERLERSRTLERSKRDSVKNLDLIYRNVQSQSKYQSIDRANKFRDRQQSKQIQKQPMRFHYVPKIVIKKQEIVAEKQNKEEEQQNQMQESSKIRRKNTMTSVSQEDDNMSLISKISKKNPIKIGKDESISQRSKQKNVKNSSVIKTEPSSSNVLKDGQSLKLQYHFHAAMDLANKQNKKLSKTAKQILQKCHIIKLKKIKVQEDRDIFQLIRKDTAN